MQTLQFEGPLDQKTIESIEKVKYLQNYWYTEMEEIIKAHEKKKESYAIPKGIITDVLEDSDELQDIIKELEAIEK